MRSAPENKYVDLLKKVMPRKNGTPEGIEALRKSLERSAKKC